MAATLNNNDGQTNKMNGISDDQNPKETPLTLAKTEDKSHIELTTKLDNLQRRVELLRENAMSVEAEKEKLLATLQMIQDNDANIEFTEDERDEVEAVTERLICRCLTVEVTVTTPRNESQEKALLRVENLLQQLENMCSQQSEKALSQAHSYLNACLTEPTGTSIDYRFQGIVLDCAIDDQKKIRQRLNDLIENLEMLEMQPTQT